MQRVRIVGVSLTEKIFSQVPGLMGKAVISEIICSERRRFVLWQDTLLGALTQKIES